MLSDHELEALRDIERRLRWESPELNRQFNILALQPPKTRRKRPRARLFVAAAAFAGLTLLGPRLLNEAEVGAQTSPPPPRTPPADATVADLGTATAVTTLGTVVDLFIGPFTTGATPPGHGPPTEHDPRRPEHLHTLSREGVTLHRK